MIYHIRDSQHHHAEPGVEDISKTERLDHCEAFDSEMFIMSYIQSNIINITENTEMQIDY